MRFVFTHQTTKPQIFNIEFLQQETQAGNSPLLPERSGEAAKKKGGTSLCLLNTSQWARLPIKEYFIKLFDKKRVSQRIYQAAPPNLPDRGGVQSV